MNTFDLLRSLSMTGITLLLLCTASIAQADRLVRIIEEPVYSTVRYYPRPVIKKTVYIQQPRRTVYIQQPRQIVYRRPVYIHRRETYANAIAAGLVGLGFGTLLGSALSQ